MDNIDVEAMETMLKMEGDMFTITTKEPCDPSTFIMPVVGQLNNWTWVGFFKSGENKFCYTSLDVLFNIFNKMNSDLAYFDVSYNIEIVHLNDSNEFENEINKQLENKIKPMEPTFETFNLGNNENPRLIKIGSTLIKKKGKFSRISSQNSKKYLHGPMKKCPELIPR